MVADYYRVIAPFYEAEMSTRDDVGDWVELARRAHARRILDLGTGGGRCARALQREAESVVGVDVATSLLHEAADFAFVQGDMRALPFAEGSFDLVVAANDPFAHLLTDDERCAAVGEALRVVGPGGVVVIEGVWLSEIERDCARTEFVRERGLGDVTLRERWHAVGDDRYLTAYEYRRDGRVVATARATLRAWRCDERVLRRYPCRIASDLEDGVFDPRGSRVVISFSPGLS